jgi:hypothetical protein
MTFRSMLAVLGLLGCLVGEVALADIQPLPVPLGSTVRLSGDGSTVIASLTGGPHGRWTETTGFQPLPLPGGEIPGASQMLDLSYDGRTVLGFTGGSSSYLWREGVGSSWVPSTFGDRTFYPKAVTGDGQSLNGIASNFEDGTIVARWPGSGGLESLWDLNHISLGGYYSLHGASNTGDTVLISYPSTGENHWLFLRDSGVGPELLSGSGTYGIHRIEARYGPAWYGPVRCGPARCGPARCGRPAISRALGPGPRPLSGASIAPDPGLR